MMEAAHVRPEGWGVCPWFTLGPLAVPAYSVLMFFAFAVGFAVCRHYARKSGANTGQIFPVVLAALFGGVLGAKLPAWVVALSTVPMAGWSLGLFLSGRTIVGGFVGAMLGVWWVKRRLGITGRFGNVLVPGVALGLAVGRIGCFLSGCCYGRPCGCGWGVDFGDGIARHPTQLYEAVFFLFAFVVVQHRMPVARPGSLMSGFLAAYFIFRFFGEFLRPGDGGLLTMFQWICLAGLLLIGVRAWFRGEGARDAE